MISTEASKAIIELSQWFAHEKLIEFTEQYEMGNKSSYRDMVRLEEIISVLKQEEKRLERGRPL